MKQDAVHQLVKDYLSKTLQAIKRLRFLLLELSREDTLQANRHKQALYIADPIIEIL